MRVVDSIYRVSDEQDEALIALPLHILPSNDDALLSWREALDAGRYQHSVTDIQRQ